MTKKTRTILFSILTALFLLVTPGIALYSWGYRLDISSRKIVQTGAFYFKVFPKSAEIYLDGNPAKKTDFFFGAALTENLLPKKYEVEIKKEGFYPWKKTLEIKEKQVTDAKNIVLIPENPEFSVLTREVENYFFSPDGKKAILKEIGNGSWALKLLELEKNVKSHLLESRDISETEITILDLNFSPDSRRILLKTGAKENARYFLVNLEKSPIELNALSFLGKGIENVFFHPGDSQKLFLLKNGSIFEADLTQKKVSKAVLENVKAFRISNRDVYYLQNSGFLFKTDLSFSGGTKINQDPFSLNKNEEYKIYVFSDKIFLQDEQNLYSFNQNSNSFENFFEAAKEPKISPDFKKLLYRSEHEIWLLFLKDEFSQPQKSANDNQFIARFSEKIGDVFWYSSHYLMFDLGSKIKIAEIDDRDNLNMIDLTLPAADNGEVKIFFNQSDKKIYILSGGSLYSSKKLIP